MIANTNANTEPNEVIESEDEELDFEDRIRAISEMYSDQCIVAENRESEARSLFTKLREVQWSGDHNFCPDCGGECPDEDESNPDNVGHADDCELATLLKELEY